jgi:ribonuclease HI
MSVPAPHFLLYAEAAQAADRADGNAGRWRFVLRLPGGETSLEAADEEPTAGPERLELLAVVRGLESLAQPSRVTLLSGSRQLRRGLEFGLSQWRENDWQWERYGRMTAIKNGDLWRRLDRLLNIHTIDCRPAKLEKADDLAPPPVAIGGRRLRFDRAESPKAKHGIRNPKSETNSKSQIPNVRNDERYSVARSARATVRFRALNFMLSNLYRISCFVLRILMPKAARHRGSIHHDKERRWHVACGSSPRR